MLFITFDNLTCAQDDDLTMWRAARSWSQWSLKCNKVVPIELDTLSDVMDWNLCGTLFQHNIFSVIILKYPYCCCRCLIRGQKARQWNTRVSFNMLKNRRVAIDKLKRGMNWMINPREIIHSVIEETSVMLWLKIRQNLRWFLIK